jgi:hypothetical protein
MDKPHQFENMKVYWLPSTKRRNAQTGETTVTPMGPYFASILGSAHKMPTDDEVRAYVRKMHGVDPVRIASANDMEEAVKESNNANKFFDDFREVAGSNGWRLGNADVSAESAAFDYTDSQLRDRVAVSARPDGGEFDVSVQSRNFQSQARVPNAAAAFELAQRGMKSAGLGQ